MDGNYEVLKLIIYEKISDGPGLQRWPAIARPPWLRLEPRDELV